MRSKFSLLFTPLPPETTILAVVNYGLLESDSSSFTKLVLVSLGNSASSTFGDP